MAKSKKPQASYNRSWNMEDPRTKSNAYKTKESASKKLLVNGYNPDDALDTRNSLEKALNLHSDTGTLLDPLSNLLEILQKPQNALFGAINNLQTGEDVVEGLKEGWKGDEQISGSQLVRNMGIGGENDKSKLSDPSTWGNYADDVLGLGLDLFLDPADLVGVGLVNKAGKARKLATKADDIGDALKAVSKGGSVADAVGMANKVDKAVDTHKALKMGVKVPFTKMNQDLTTPTEFAFKTLGKGIKGTVKGTDRVIEDFLGANSDDLLQGYKNVKTELTDKLNSASRQGRNLARKTVNSLSGYTQTAGEEATSDLLKQTVSFGEDILNNKNTLDNLNKVYEFEKPLSKELLEKDPELFYKHLKEIQGDMVKSKELEIFKKKLVEEAGVDFTNKIPDGEKILPFENIFDISLSTDLAREGNGDAFIPFSTQSAKVQGTINHEMNALIDYAKKMPSNSKYKAISTYKDAGGLFNFKDNKNGFYVIPSDLVSDFRNLANDLLHRKVEEGAEPILTNLRLDSLEHLGYHNPTKGTVMMGNKSISNVNFKTLREIFNNPENNGAFDKYFNVVPNTLNSYDKAMGVDMAGSLTGHEDYIPVNMNKTISQVQQNVLGNKKGYSYKKDLGVKSTTSSMPSTVINDIYRRIIDINDANFMPEVQGKSRETVFNMIRESGFFDQGADVMDNLASMVNPSGGVYSKKLKDILSFNKVVTQDISDNLDKEFNDMIRLRNAVQDGQGYKEVKKELIENIRNSNSGIHVLTPDLFNDLPDAIKSELVAVPRSQIDQKINSIKQYIDSGYDKAGVGKQLKNVLDHLYTNLGTNNLYFDKHVAGYLNMFRDEAQLGDIVKGINSINNNFKKFKLLSPGFNIRNYIGNYFNMVVAGVPPKEIASAFNDSIKKVGLADDALRMIQSGVPTDKIDKKLMDALNDVNELRYMGFSEAGTLLQNLDEIAKTPLNKINELNVALNNKVDLGARLAMKDFVAKNPTWMKKMGFKDAYEAIAYCLFDPQDISRFEDRTLRKIIPFYTFSKKNLIYQMQNLPKNGRIYYELKKVYDDLWEAQGLEDDEISDYRKRNLEIPLFKTGEDTTATLAPNLPITDLLELLENPVSSMVNKTSPIIKAPFEMALNKQLYTGQPISNYKGEKGKLTSRTPLANTPLNNQYTDYLLSNLGLDVPIKTTANFWDLVTGNSLQDPTLGNLMGNLGALSGVVKENNSAKAQISKDYQDAKKLQEYIKYLGQDNNLQSLADYNRAKSNSQNKFTFAINKADDLLNK